MIKLSAENGWVTNDRHGIRMPWYTSGMLKVLDRMDFNGKKVFEYGVGYSTLWYRSRNAIVYGVDSNPFWSLEMGVEHYEDLNNYKMSIIMNPHDFDIVVIDGIHRDECTKWALMRLVSGGMLIIDNWMQPSVEPNEWTNTLELTKGMKSEVFAQEGHPDWKTIYFIKP